MVHKKASDVLNEAAQSGIRQRFKSIADRKGKTLSALGVLAWKAGALYSKGNSGWMIDDSIFEQAYHWSPSTEPHNWEYYFDDESPESEWQNEFDKAAFANRIQQFMEGIDGGDSGETMGEFLTLLNNELKWPFYRIASRLRECGL